MIIPKNKTMDLGYLKIIPKEKIICDLVNEVNSLKNRVKDLEKRKFLVQEDSLVELWDNKEDEIWNNC